MELILTCLLKTCGLLAQFFCRLQSGFWPLSSSARHQNKNKCFFFFLKKKKGARVWNSWTCKCVNILTAPYDHMELITFIFWHIRLCLLKDILENESTPVSCRSQMERFIWRQVVHLQSLGQEEWYITMRLNQVWCGSLVLCGLQHTQAPLFSEGKLVVGMMSSVMIVSNVKLM